MSLARSKVATSSLGTVAVRVDTRLNARRRFWLLGLLACAAGGCVSDGHKGSEAVGQVAATAAGNAVVLDGRNWVAVPKTANYVPAEGFTWEAWFNGASLPTDTTSRIDAALSGQMLFVVADGLSCVDFSLGFGGTNRAPAELAFTVDGPGGCGTRDTTPVHYRPTGGFQNLHWYHVAAVRDYTAQSVALYLDGVLVDSKADTTAPIAGAGFSASIGRWTDGGFDVSHFMGAIDEVRVYGRPLSAAEIGQHFNAGAGRPGIPTEPGLVAGWHLDETTGTAAMDYGAAHLDGMYVNSPAHAPGIVRLP